VRVAFWRRRRDDDGKESGAASTGDPAHGHARPRRFPRFRPASSPAVTCRRGRGVGVRRWRAARGRAAVTRGVEVEVEGVRARSPVASGGTVGAT
jgi:hypothetical protein